MGFLDRIFGARSAALPATGDPLRIAEVEAVLARLRPLLHQDGGDVELVGIDAGRVRVRMVGACTRCWSRESTLSGALEPALRESCDWFDGLDAV